MALVNAYSAVLKYSVKNGLDLLTVKQFRDSLDAQINNNVLSALKEEEWLLDSVGLGTLRNSNLLPTVESPVKAKDVYEAFIRFDDKPMITDAEAVRKSLIKYCYEGAFCIASGTAGPSRSSTRKRMCRSWASMTRTTGCWTNRSSPRKLLRRGDIITPQPPPKRDEGESGADRPEAGGAGATARELKSITISGSVPLERYTELFNYFITPFAMSGNKIQIGVSFKTLSSEGSPITESKQQYKSAKEAAKQLGLNFEEEPK